MNNELIDFINILLLDGEISEKEKKQVFEKANTLGIPAPECEVILESLLGQAQKKTVSAKKTVKKKVPKYQKKASLNKTDILNQNIEEELAKQQKASENLKSIQSQIDSRHSNRNSLLKEADDFHSLLKVMSTEYKELLNKIRSDLEKSLGSEVIEKDQFENNLLYRADKKSIKSYFQNATWNINKLTVRRKVRYYIFTGMYYLIWVYITIDWIYFSAEDGGLISDEQWLGFKWWQMIIGALLFGVVAQVAKSKIEKNEMDFNQEDIDTNINEILTQDVQDQLKFYNELKKELNSNNNLRSRKFN